MKDSNGQNTQGFEYVHTEQAWFKEQEKCREDFDRLMDRVSHITDLIDQKVKALGYTTCERMHNTDWRDLNDRQ